MKSTTSLRQYVSDPHGYFPQQFPNLNLSASPFRLVPALGNHKYSFLSCSSTKQNLHYYRRYFQIPIACLSNHSHKVFLTESDQDFHDMPLLSCKKMHNMSRPFMFDFQTNDIQLNWTKPMCKSLKYKYCRLTNNSTEQEIECLDKTKRPTTGTLLLVSVFLVQELGFSVMVLLLRERAFKKITSQQGTLTLLSRKLQANFRTT